MDDLLIEASKIQKRLATSGIQTAIIGGLAVAAWGEPRLTRDVDLKVLLPRERAQDLVGAIKKGYTFVVRDPVGTIRKFGFIFVRARSGVRLDLLMAETPFDEAALKRSRRVALAKNCRLTVCSAEDLVIYKMISTRPRDREDVWGIVLRQKRNLDDRYILRWLGQFEKALDDSTLIRDYKTLKAR